MGTQVTTNYGWIYPNPFEEDDAWGPILNAVFVDIDADLKVVADSKQPLDPQLTALAGVTAVSDALPYFTGATTAAVTTLTAAGRALIDDADATAQRTTLGLGGLATLSAVGAAEITDGSVGTAEIADGAVSTAKVADGAVTTVKLADANVTTAKVADGAITAAKLAAGVIPAAFPSGTRILFNQNAAPTGWTKDTNPALNHALRVTGGTLSGGGSVAFTDAFTNRAISGTAAGNNADFYINAHTLTWNEMPYHAHDYALYGGSSGGGSSGGGKSNFSTTTYAGASWGHAHGVTQNPHGHTVTASLNMAVAYVDVIIAQKD